MIDIIKDKAGYCIQVQEDKLPHKIVRILPVTAEELLVLLKKLKEREESLKLKHIGLFV